MSRTKNIFSMLFYGVKLKMINLLALLINLAILAYTAYDTYKSPESLWDNELITIIIFFLLNVIWQTVSTLAEIISYVRPSGHWIENRKNIKQYLIDSEVEKTYVSPADLPKDIPVIIDDNVNAILLSDMPIQIRPLKSHSKKVWNYIFQNKGILHPFLMKVMVDYNCYGVMDSRTGKMIIPAIYTDIKLASKDQIMAEVDGDEEYNLLFTGSGEMIK